MDLELQNKYALVSGGSHGIGRAIALLLAENGCNVCIFSRDKDRVDSVVKEILLKGVKAMGIYKDAVDRDAADFVMNRIKEEWNPIDILINNVGGGGRWGSEDYEEFDEWEDVYEKNAGISRKLTMKCLPHMRSNDWGRVITISSIYGKESGGRPWFNMSKAAEISLMKNLAGKYNGITFNTIAPGYIDVGNGLYSGENKPEDVAGIVVFLCSGYANYISGACITVDNGESKGF